MPLSFSFCVLFFFHQGVQKKVDVFNNFSFCIINELFPFCKKGQLLLLFFT